MQLGCLGERWRPRSCLDLCSGTIMCSIPSMTSGHLWDISRWFHNFLPGYPGRGHRHRWTFEFCWRQADCLCRCWRALGLILIAVVNCSSELSIDCICHPFQRRNSGLSGMTLMRTIFLFLIMRATLVRKAWSTVHHVVGGREVNEYSTSYTSGLQAIFDEMN